MAVSSSTVLRVRGLPSNWDIDEVTSLLDSSLQIGSEASGLKITSLAEDPYDVKKQIATLVFLKDSPPPFKASTADQWSINISGSDRAQTLTFDTHFRGLTAMNTPGSKEEAVDCVAVCGLGGHAFGSFKEKGTSYMWLRDSLPKDLPNLRVLLYGYESKLDESESNQNISVVADSLVSHLSHLRSHSKPIATPLIIIAHSLGGLVVKQAIMKLGRGNESDRKHMETVVGMLFFGVPNRGMDIESLQSIVCNQKNRYLLESVGQYSDLLLQQDGQFGSTFHFKDSPIVSFFETKASPTAIKVNDLWKMAGPKKVLMDRFSATRARLWESHEEPLNHTHSDTVKFSGQDVDYECVLKKLRDIASKATATLSSRYLDQEFPSILNADEEACIQSLSFTGIYTRESIIEPAIQDTGSWLLESQDFQDWSQRKRLDEHRGFFWIQGNPGSGKSTLMKKVYSHALACRRDPSSVTAAFFFNARGDEIEKSPTGLFRTLLHALCQRISALRDVVVKAYVAKRRLLTPNWQWQISELKEFLAAVVKSSVLGQRSLLLFVDALDECDFAATQSVIHFFEDLARSSVSEDTNFNLCLSSRYWPQFRVQNSFVARVELENEGDIVRYIEKRLQSTQVNENLKLHAALRTEILDKAKGTFLWVVLVIRDLLQANIAGATLRALRDIVQRVPQDLSDLYQRQLEDTKSEDRERMLRLLQLVFYAQRPLNPTELRYALAFGCGAFSSYAEWSESSDYVRNDEQMEKRIREHSKGLVEIAQVAKDGKHPQDSASSREAVVQFIHQSVKDYLARDGFSFLRDTRWPTHSAEGHDFIKMVCCNYLRAQDLEALLSVDLKVNQQFRVRGQMPDLVADHPLLEYAVQYVFLHAAQAEQHGVSQDGFRNYIHGNIQGCFERWREFYDMLFDDPYEDFSEYLQGPEARPIHVLAQYGLLTKDIAEKEANIDVEGGAFCSALVAACWGGHQDAVGILLEQGADPRFDASHAGSSKPWGTSMAPFSCAVYNQDLSVLRQLVNAQRAFLTLQERLDLSGDIRTEKPYLEAFLSLLFPEATFPDSAGYDLYQALGSSTIRVFFFLLDRSNDAIMHEKKLWHSVFLSKATTTLSKIRALLDRGGRVEITVEILHQLSSKYPVKEVFSLLLAHGCNAEMTEDLIEAMSEFEDSSQIIRVFEVAGHRFDTFTPKQLRGALRNGSAETAAFFLERQPGNISADERDEMLASALSNSWNGEEVTRLLLGYLRIDHIDEQVIIAALESPRCGGELLRLLHSRWSNLTFSGAALAVAVRYQRLDDVKFVLERCECVGVTEKVLTAAAENMHSAVNLEYLLLHDPDVNVSESVVVQAIHRSFLDIDYFNVLSRHGKSLVGTENVIAAAAKEVYGPDILRIILKQDRGAKISSSMIMVAMQARRGAALVSVMLHHDHTLAVTEKHLVAAASNPYDPSLIFSLLQNKGKLGSAYPASETSTAGPALVRRHSHQSLPGISKKVINAASSNPREAAKLRLLELFMEWNVITATEYNKRTRTRKSRSRLKIPSLSQLFLGSGSSPGK